MKIKLTLLVIFFLILIPFFSINTKKDTEIIFWTLQMSDYKEYLNTIISEYEKQTGLKIKWVDVPFSEGEKRTLSAILSKNPPDLINLNPDFSVMLAQKGALTFFEKEQLNQFSPAVTDSLTYKNKIYAIPWYATSAITFYNTNYVKTSPKKYEDILAISKTANKKVFAFMPTITENDTMAKILNKYGVNSYKNINSDQSIKVFKLFKKMYDTNLIPPESVTQTHREALEKYMAGKIVYFQGGANFLNIIKENAPDIYEKTGISEQIKGDLGQNDFSLMNLIIPLKAKHPKEALNFALYLTNEKNQLELAKLTNVIATNKIALGNDFYKRNGDLIQKAVSTSSKQLNNVNPVFIQNKNSKEINLLINDAVQKILINGEDIKLTLDEVAKKWQELED